MSRAPAIEVRGVTKRFGDVEALGGVDLVVEPGTVYGLLGPNGAGKTTTVRVLTTIITPDSGTAEVLGLDVTKHPQEVRASIGLAGQYAAVDEVLTGRENLYLNAAILGMTEAETRRKFDDIVEFAELGNRLDTQVGHYSSGQTARLGFAIAIHVDSDIFLVDEALAVGDKPFKRKCLTRMEEVRQSGRTLFYVSHAAGSVKKMCDRVLVLENGRLGFDGDVDAGIRYLHYESDDVDTDGEGDELEEDFDEDTGDDI